MDRYVQSSVAQVFAAYERGVQTFENVRVDRGDFRMQTLLSVGFSHASMRGVRLDRATLHGAWFSNADLTDASLECASLYNVRFTQVRLVGARLWGSELVEAVIVGADLTGADLTESDLTQAHLVSSRFAGVSSDAVSLGGTTFSDIDLSAFCDGVDVVHEGPSYVDFRSVLRSCHHPGLKRFLVDCGVAPLVAEYTVAAAEAERDALATLMRSTFISYGGPDEAFARRLYDELRAHGVTTFFFPETARLGRRIGDEVHSRIQEHDRVILVCSRESLDRPGVRNEIQATFDREARDGGATYLLPIMLDDYVLSGWKGPLTARVRDRVVGDFRGALDDGRNFDRAMSRLLAALRKDPG